MAYEIPEGPHRLKLGSSFDKRREDTYHTVKYDFKPASLEVCKESYVDFAPSSETTILFLKTDDSENIKDVTLFKGSRKPYQKECLLIYDHETGEFTLEDLTYCIQLKQVRSGEEEKEKAVKYAKEVKHKCRHVFQQSTGKEVGSEAKTSTSNDLVMSEEDSDSSSATSSSDEEAEGQTAETVGSASEEEDEGEDDIAKSLEAVVAANVPKSEPNVARESLNADPTSASTTKRQPPPAQQTLHDDLHLSDSSEEDD